MSCKLQGTSAREISLSSDTDAHCLKLHPDFTFGCVTFRLGRNIGRVTMADFTGMTVKLTLKHPTNTVVHGTVVEVIAGQTLTLQDGNDIYSTVQ